MPGLFIHYGNRSEVLARELGAILRDQPLADPVAIEQIVVHSRGMGRWLSMVLARELGICANVDFPFPAKVLRSAMTRALDALDRRDRGLGGDGADRAEGTGSVVGSGTTGGVPGGTGGPSGEVQDRSRDTGHGPRGQQDRIPGPGLDGDPWDPDRMTWVLLDVLPRHRDYLEPALREYLSAGDPAVVCRKEYQFARRIANLFDEYANYRPEWIRAWDNGEGITVKGVQVEPEAPGGSSNWQPILWRAVRDRIGQPHPAGRVAQAVRAFQDPALDITDLPPRLSLFGISTLPPSFVRILLALAARIDVRLFALSPSMEYFGDMMTRDESARYLAAHDDSDVAEMHDYGNPLLKSLGGLGRDFHALLTRHEESPGIAGSGQTYQDPAPDCEGSMLGILQSDILNLRHRRPGGDDEPVSLDAPDGSIRFHACHGALRQVEVLRDELLHLFKQDPSLQPRDVVIMSPDIDAYAPLIDAVFSDGDGRSESRHAEGDTLATAGQERVSAGFPALRHQIADRSDRQLNVVAEAISRILALAAGRLPASEVLDLLALEPVRTTFGLEGNDLDTVRTWVAASGARWGLDEGHRLAEGQPGDRLNTWRFGLDRLLVGVALPGEGRRTFGDVLPCDGIEGSQARILGRFARFCRTLFDACALIGSGPRSLADWEELAHALVEEFVDLPDSHYWKIRKTLKAFRDLSSDSTAADFGRTVDLDTVRALLDERLGESSSQAALLAGGLNFCAMVPMRTIPFRVVCLLGMDDGVFPRQQRRTGFDLLALHPARGDRSPRDDDRHLFLEAILAARDRLVVTWNGRSIRDNTDLPPAVPVGELLDVLAESFAFDDAGFDDRRDMLIRKQPLQAFSPENFADPSTRGFDQRALQGARRLLGDREAEPAFFPGPLPEPGPDELVVTVDDLARFFENPMRHLLSRRLGIRLGNVADDIQDREPVFLEGLEGWQIGDDLLGALLAGDSPEIARRRVRMQGRMPLGIPGEIALDRILADAGTVADLARPLRGGAHRPVDVTVEAGGLAIRGTLDHMWERGQVVVQFSRIRAKPILGTWIRHLLACAADPGFSGSTWLVGRGAGGPKGAPVLVFQDQSGTVQDGRERAIALLNDLAALYRHGMCRPLLLFPESSRAYASTVGDADDPETLRKARNAANLEWATPEGADFPREDADPYFQWILRGRNPWGAGFELPGLSGDPSFLPDALALRVWAPLLPHVRGVAGEDAP
jgi:exodeoxyribonuclease V gamma subunit